MNYKEYKNNQKYSEASGVLPLVDGNFYMKLNDYGLYEEKVKDFNEFNYNSVRKVSPNFNDEEDEDTISRELFSNIENIKYNERLGYYISNYIGHVSENKIRENSSSGGFGTWILLELLKNNLIDGVIHVKYSKSETEKRLFKYDLSTTPEEIQKGAKTKYYPVELSEVLQLIKDKPGRYAIVGIPSFIMAVRLLSKAVPLFKERIVFTIGLICGHQKSTKFTDYMSLQAKIKPDNLFFIDYRHKLLNNSADQYGVKFVEKIGEATNEIVIPKNELLGQNWGQGFFKSFSSDYTDDVMNETADITLGDAWLPEYTSDPLGNNILIVRNNIINDLIDKANEEGRINVKIVDTETINKSQDAHFRHTQLELSYRLYKKKLENKWTPNKRVNSSNVIDSNRKQIQDLREIISTSSHQYYHDFVKDNNLSEFNNKMAILVNEYDNHYKKIYFQQVPLSVKIKLIIKYIINKLK